MPVTEAVIRSVVQEVLAELRGQRASRATGDRQLGAAADGKEGRYGLFSRVEDAVAAAAEAQKKLQAAGSEARARAVACIRRICIEQAEPLGREEFAETRIGRLDHKIEKMRITGERIPGVEFLQTHAYSGSQGLTLVEYAPFGVIGVVTPVTHSLPTLAGNAINMIAAGNALVCNPHPSGAGVARHGVELFNRAIHRETGIDNLIAVITEPTLETAQALFDHREVKLLCVTGGPAVGRAALSSRKRAIVAGPGNPPVVVDETADLEHAARCIVRGAAYDNNLLCIGEKQVFAVASIFDELCAAMEAAGAVRLADAQIEQLTRVAFVRQGEGTRERLVVNKELIGKDPEVLAQRAGFSLPRRTELLFGETSAEHPFVQEEQMMPFVPFVRVPDVDTAIEWARRSEHGFRHTAIIHSRNVDAITAMARALDTTLFVANGPCMAALGIEGEGYLSYSIATPTGEGVTTPLTFTRQRRLSVARGALCIAR